jgi:Tfp pilus assembly protein PilV
MDNIGTRLKTDELRGEQGFTLLEVAFASIITVIGLIFLASLFTLAISQNKFVKQFTSTTMLAQQKLEELNAIELNDPQNRLTVGGNLTEATKQANYYDYLDEKGASVGSQATAVYRRYWKVEPDPQLGQAVIISVRVEAVQASRGRNVEETTLTTVRSF